MGLKHPSGIFLLRHIWRLSNRFYLSQVRAEDIKLMKIYKIARDIRKYPLGDFCRKAVIAFNRDVILRILLVIRRFWSLIYLRKWDIIIGKNVSFTGFAAKIKIGSNVNIYDNCCFFFNNESSLEIGNSCILSYGVVVSCRNKISIGNFVQIGEYSSLRDSTHSMDNSDVPIMYQENINGEITIGNNVWIGRGCILLPGTFIEDGVVVGANSLVKGRLEKNCVYGGTPLRLIRPRA